MIREPARPKKLSRPRSVPKGTWGTGKLSEGRELNKPQVAQERMTSHETPRLSDPF